MPHIVVKMYRGRSEAEKARLADALAVALKETVGASDASISIVIEDVEPSDWMDQVYAPEIESRVASLYKRPGYGPAGQG